jgi:hypothetical protein
MSVSQGVQAYAVRPRLFHCFGHSCARSIRAVVVTLRPTEHKILIPAIRTDERAIAILLEPVVREGIQCRDRYREAPRLL